MECILTKKKYIPILENNGMPLSIQKKAYF
jgi:hypothetical protein